MRRIIPLVLLTVALTACGDNADESSAPEQDENAGTTEALTETTVSQAPSTTEEPATTEPPTTEAPEITSTTTAISNGAGFEILPATPPAVFDSFVSTMTIQMGFDDQVFEVTGNGSWTGNAFECTMAMSVSGLEFSQSVVGTPEAIWFDDGTGFEESAVNSTTQDVISSCAGSPSFWDDFVNPGVDISGETEQFAGRSALKVDLREILDYGGGLGMVPEIDDATIDKMDMWVDEETNVVLGISAEIAIDPESMGELGLPGDPNTESVVMTMELALDRINDPTISIEIPPG